MQASAYAPTTPEDQQGAWTSALIGNPGAGDSPASAQAKHKQLSQEAATGVAPASAGKVRPAVAPGRKPFGNAENRGKLPTSQRRTSTWVNKVAVEPLAQAPESTSACVSASGCVQPESDPIRGSGTKAPGAVVWHADFARNVEHSEAVSARSMEPLQSNTEQRGGDLPASGHALARPQRGAVTRALEAQAAAVAAAAPPTAAATRTDMEALASKHAATMTANVAPDRSLYHDLPAVKVTPGVLSPPDGKKVAAARRAALARLPRADMIAPSMRDIWKAEDQVVEVTDVYEVSAEEPCMVMPDSAAMAASMLQLL